MVIILGYFNTRKCKNTICELGPHKKRNEVLFQFYKKTRGNIVMNKRFKMLKRKLHIVARWEIGNQCPK